MPSPTIPDAVVRTAVDALLAKYSAIWLAGYTPKGVPHDGRIVAAPPVASSSSTATTPSIPNTIITHISTACYEELLQYMISYLIPSLSVKPKRQTPLINAGYGIRVSTVLQQIESYISFHRHYYCYHHHHPSNGPHRTNQNAPPEIQIIVVGCGFDVTGLWSLSLANEMGIHVVEIDAPAVVTRKVPAIQPLLDLQRSATSETTTIPTWHGVVVGPHNHHHSNNYSNAKARYTICAADLQDPSSVETIFTSILDTSRPTLLVSELVLTYLPRESSDFLLRRFATLFRHAASGTVLYEPLGPTTTTTTKQTKHSSQPFRSILESYQASYGISFNAKLQRGMAHQNTPPTTTTTTNGTQRRGREHGGGGDVPSSPRFHPLGASPAELRERLERLGYDQVNVVTAGKMASYHHHHHHHEWNAMELFDEHAALTLHLRSYVVVTAFPNASSSTMDLDHEMFRHYLCPWMERPTGLLLRPQPIGKLRVDHESILATDSCLWISTVRKPDERQVRELFHQTYRHLFDEYPSIRKMVKSALRNDLGVGGGGGGTDPSYSVEAAANDDSKLALGYQKQGGDFIVVVRTHPSSATIVEPAAISAEHAHNNVSRVRRQVLGGIGIRQCTTVECVSRSIPSHDTICYEIHRFFVNGEYRGNGIGAALFEIMTSHIIQRRQRQLQRLLRRRRPTPINHNSDNTMSSSNDKPLLYLTATTPTILREANRFYHQHGFTIHSTVEMGELTMNTYMKAVSASQSTFH